MKKLNWERLTVRSAIKSQVIFAFWLVLSYYLLEDKRRDEVINFLFLYYILYYVNKSNFSDNRLRCIQCLHHILMLSVIYYWTVKRQHGIYLFIQDTKLDPCNDNEITIKSVLIIKNDNARFLLTPRYGRLMWCKTFLKNAFI